MTNQPPSSSCSISSDSPSAPITERIADTVTDVARTGAEAVHRVNDAVQYARGPGRPLDIISTVARKAPLSSLLVTFLLGVAFARRR